MLDTLSDETVALIDFTGLSSKTVFNIQDVLRKNKWRRKNVVMIDSLSKKYEMCHVRAGYIVASNPELALRLKLDLYAPVLTEYAYEKLGEALDDPRIATRILRQHRRYFQNLKSVEDDRFKVVSPSMSNFVVARFREPLLIDYLLQALATQFDCYDLPFRGLGLHNGGEGSISQDVIQFLPKCDLRLLEETAPFLAPAIAECSRKRWGMKQHKASAGQTRRL